MWCILRAELGYNKKLFLGLLSLIPLICLYETAVSGERMGYVLITASMLTVFWNVFRNKDKRDYQHARLPLAAKEIARARILMIAIAGAVADILYYVTYFLLNFRKPDEAIKLLAYLGIIFFSFSIYFILRDLALEAFRKLGLNRNSVKAAIILFGVGLQVMTVYAILQTKATGKTHVLLRYLDKMNMLADPPFGDFAVAVFLILSLVLAYSTIFTFGWRKTYL